MVQTQTCITATVISGQLLCALSRGGESYEL